MDRPYKVPSVSTDDLRRLAPLFPDIICYVSDKTFYMVHIIHFSPNVSTEAIVLKYKSSNEFIDKQIQLLWF